jgi:acetyltransferase-like isoleucine patch superfamily enzyme
MLSDADVVGTPKLLQATLLRGYGKIVFHDKTMIGYYPSPGFLSTHGYIDARTETASIVIGARTTINNAATIVCERSEIHIGSDCLIGANFSVYDSDFHPTSRIERELRPAGHKCEPVKISDWVFIGNNVTVLKGSTIGRGATIAAGSVVVGNVPPDTIFGGVPARLLRRAPA